MLINRFRAGRKYFTFSQIALVCFFVVDLSARHAPTFHADLADGLRGFFLSVAVGLIIIAGRKQRRSI